MNCYSSYFDPRHTGGAAASAGMSYQDSCAVFFVMKHLEDVDFRSIGLEASNDITLSIGDSQPPNSAAEWTALATHMAANPWAQSWPLWLDAVQLQYTADAECPWWLWADARAIPLAISEADAWQLMAMPAVGQFQFLVNGPGNCCDP